MTTQLLSPPSASSAPNPILLHLAVIDEAGGRVLHADVVSSGAVRDLPWRRWRIAEAMGADFQRALQALEALCRDAKVFDAPGGATCRETIVALRRGRLDLTARAVEPGPAAERDFEVVLARVGRLWEKGVDQVRRIVAGGAGSSP